MDSKNRSSRILHDCMTCIIIGEFVVVNLLASPSLKMRYLIVSVICSFLVNESLSFISSPRIRNPRVKPVNENFFLDIAEDPVENTPKEIFGEVAYKSFVESYNSKGIF